MSLETKVKVRTATADETVLRFVYQSKHMNAACLRKHGVTPLWNEAKERYELSVYLPGDLLASDDPEFWDQARELGRRDTDAKGFGLATVPDVQSVQLQVEVNHDPDCGHCDIWDWVMGTGDEAKMERMEQANDLGKVFKAHPRPVE